MPRISEFFGIEIYLYWRDHPPPHFHAHYGGDEVAVSIADLTVLAGGLPPRATGLIMEWAAIHHAELESMWDRATNLEPLGKIDPLRWEAEMKYHVVAIEPRAGSRLWVRFADGVEGEADLSDIAGRGVFARWTERPEEFDAVSIHPETRAPVWPGGLDVGPDALYSEVLRTLQAS